MPHTILARLSNLERVALQFEGAHFAYRDVVARLLARLPEADVCAMLPELVANGEAHAEELGDDRLTGYRDELQALREETEHCRGGVIPA